MTMMSKKLLLLGDMGVGKTSLIRRLILDELPTDYLPTMGVDLYRYHHQFAKGGRQDMLEFVVWDIDGSYGPSIFQHVYSKGASAALIIGDVLRPATISLMVDLAQGFQAAMPGREFAFILNKEDLVASHGEVILPAPLQTARQPVIWTSALKNTNVKPAFATVAEAVIRREA